MMLHSLIQFFNSDLFNVMLAEHVKINHTKLMILKHILIVTLLTATTIVTIKLTTHFGARKRIMVLIHRFIKMVSQKFNAHHDNLFNNKRQRRF